MTSRTARARVTASWAALEHLAAMGIDSTNQELAKAAGISDRTFYRYFPSKSEILRPVMRESLDEIARSIEAQPLGTDLRDALTAAVALEAGGAHLQRTRRLLPVLYGSELFAAVWSQEMGRPRPPLLSAIARRLRCSSDDAAVAIAATVFLALLEESFARAARDDVGAEDALDNLFTVLASDLFG